MKKVVNRTIKMGVVLLLVLLLTAVALPYGSDAHSVTSALGTSAHKDLHEALSVACMHRGKGYEVSLAIDEGR